MWTWFGIIVVLVIFEAATVDLVTIWYIASALVSLILSIFVKEFYIQFLVFVLLGTVLLLTTRKYLVNLLKIKEPVKTNLDRVIGKNAIVTLEIDKNKLGEVKVDGKTWTALSNKKINVGSVVKILKIDGVKLIVEEVNE